MFAVDGLSVRPRTRPTPRGERLVVAAPLIVRPHDVLHWMGAKTWHLEEVDEAHVKLLCQRKSCPPALVVDRAIANVLDALPVERSLAAIRHVGSLRQLRPIVIGERVRPIAIVRHSSRYVPDWFHLTLGIELLCERGRLLASVEVGVEVRKPERA